MIVAEVGSNESLRDRGGQQARRGPCRPRVGIDGSRACTTEFSQPQSLNFLLPIFAACLFRMSVKKKFGNI